MSLLAGAFYYLLTEGVQDFWYTRLDYSILFGVWVVTFVRFVRFEWFEWFEWFLPAGYHLSVASGEKLFKIVFKIIQIFFSIFFKILFNFHAKRALKSSPIDLRKPIRSISLIRR